MQNYIYQIIGVIFVVISTIMICDARNVVKKFFSNDNASINSNIRIVMVTGFLLLWISMGVIYVSLI